MRLSPSEVVYIHPLGFADPARRGLHVPGATGPVQRDALARMLLVTCTVACASGRQLTLRATVPLLAFVPLGRSRRLRVTPGTTEQPWPRGSLEEALSRVAGAASDGLALAQALRGCMPTAGATAPNPIEFVERGLRSRDLCNPEALRDPEAADETQRLLSEFREREPELWVDLNRCVERLLRGGVLRDFIPAPADPPEPRSGRRRDYLAGWKRLNPNPPSATRPPKRDRKD